MLATTIIAMTPGTMGALVFLGVVGFVALILFVSAAFTVEQQTRSIVERFGKFKEIAAPGLNWKVPFMDRVAGVVSHRVQELEIDVESKTKDDVFVDLKIAVQFFVGENDDAVMAAYYKLTQPKRQISSYVFDTVRAVVPDMLSREGGTDAVADVPPVLSEIPRDRHTNDALAAIQFLKDQGATKIGIIGFCFGGAVTWRAAVASADLSAAVPFYGSNPPLEGVSDIKAAVFAVYGALDERVNAGIDDMMSALKAAGTTHDHKVYADAPHAFHNHTNADRHNAAAAKDAWADALGWFDKHLK